MQSLCSWVGDDTEDGKDCEDGIDQVQEPGLNVLDREGHPEECADGLDEDQPRRDQGKPE